jgi:YD repeat-containing protein
MRPFIRFLPFSFPFSTVIVLLLTTVSSGLVLGYHTNVAEVKLDPKGLPIEITEIYTTNVPGSFQPAQKSYKTKYTYYDTGWLKSRSDPYDLDNPPNPIPSTSFGYDKAGNLITTTNQLGQTAVYTYDKVGNLEKAVNFIGQEIRYGYDHARRLVTVTQVLESGNLVTVNSYDAANNITKTVDPKGVATYYAYDNANRIVEVKVDLQDGRKSTTSYSYDANGNISSITRPIDDTINNKLQTTGYEYDELDRLVTTTVGVGDPIKGYPNYKVVYIYDLAGNLSLVRRGKLPGHEMTNWNDPAQVVTTSIKYDVLKRPTEIIVDPWKPGDPLNVPGRLLKTQITYDDLEGIETITDPAGVKTTIKRDPLGQVIKTTVGAADGSATPQTSYNYYDARGLLIRTVDPEQNYRDTGYDKLGRVERQTSYAGPNATNPVETTISYDETTPRPKVTVTGAGTKQEGYLDEAGRLVRTVQHAAANNLLTTRYEYDGQSNLTKLIDANQNTTYFNYDNPGWLKVVTRTVTSQGQSQVLTTTYSHDLLGNVVRTTNPEGKATEQSYTILGQVESTKDALGNTWRNYYDGLGRLVKSQDAKVQTSDYKYDNAGRLFELATAGQQIKSLYDYNAKGLLTGVREVKGGSTITMTMGYDSLSRMTGINSAQGLVNYGYDNANRRTQLSFNTFGTASKVVTYTYDGLSRPTGVKNWLNQTLEYRYEGQFLKEARFPNGVTANYSFDGAGRLSGMSQVKDATTIFAATYDLDDLGNILSASENSNGVARTQTYTYDELSRLTRETRTTNQAGALPITSTYLYDRNSNRKTFQTTLPPNSKGSATPLVMTTQYYYDNADRLGNTDLTGSATPFNGHSDSFVYDANGSLTNHTNGANSGEVKTYSYDVRGRLTGWQQTLKGVSQNTTFGYNSLGMRVRTTSAGSPDTQYLLDGGGAVLQEFETANPNAATSYAYGMGNAPVFSQRSGAATGAWYHTDSSGSVRALTGATGNLEAAFGYSAFGEKTYSNYPSGGTLKEAPVYGWGGMRQEANAGGLHYDAMSGSYYNSAAGVPTSQGQEYGESDFTPGGDEAGLVGGLGGVADFADLSSGHPAVRGFGMAGGDQNYASVEDPWLSFLALCGAPEDFNSQDMALLMLDVATGMMPFVSTARDIVELTTGRNMITGEKLTDFDKYMAIGSLAIDAVSFGLGGMAARGTKTFAKALIKAGKPAQAAKTLAKEGRSLGRGLGKAMGRGVAGKGWAAAGRGSKAANGLARGADASTEARAVNKAVSNADTPAQNATGSGRAADEGASCNSFTAETPVLTENGLHPIAEVKEGDKVWAQDPESGESGYYTVTWTTNHVTDEVVQITVSGSTGDSFAANELSLSYDQDFVVEPSGIAGANRLGSRSGSSSGASPANSYSETIEATAAHPIWVVGKGWIDAGALVVGDKLLAKDGSYLTVTKLGLVKKQVRVYNFEVAKLHTYFVGGQQQWLVHNTGLYDCLAWRDYLSQTYGVDNVSSTTVPRANSTIGGNNLDELARTNGSVNVQLNGNTVRIPIDKRGFPIFDDFMMFETRISPNTYLNRPDDRGSHMREATRNLRAVVNNNAQLRAQFTDVQLRAIRGGRANIPGFTWHHHQDYLKMQLLPTDLHGALSHAGGIRMWQGW